MKNEFSTVVHLKCLYRAPCYHTNFIIEIYKENYLFTPRKKTHYWYRHRDEEIIGHGLLRT